MTNPFGLEEFDDFSVLGYDDVPAWPKAAALAADYRKREAQRALARRDQEARAAAEPRHATKVPCVRVALYNASRTLQPSEFWQDDWMPSFPCSGPYRLTVSVAGKAEVVLESFKLGGQELVHAGGLPAELTRGLDFDGQSIGLGHMVRYRLRNIDCVTAQVFVLFEAYRPNPNGAVAPEASEKEPSEKDVDALERELAKIQSEYERECQSIDREYHERTQKFASRLSPLAERNDARDASARDANPCAVCGKPTGGCCPLGPTRLTRDSEDHRRLGHITDMAATAAYAIARAQPLDEAEDAAWESPQDEWP